ncbi:LacI family DNA-binding transcriptional regulator [Nonomuraea sediminis]|uniref:LacI family DNA-binding transcriptional regulator n=1 Tax=Nonomuraea sediminis TaxID=2835864 RepID=UPI001BDD144A|nr:LacI family DNA-binding transcriptional regulator [Nonomuraea sediminis]
MNHLPRVRLVDVAVAAEVSTSTVSAALNGTGRLSDTTRERVREAARRLGYRPDPTARLLRAGHTRLIGLAAREYVESPWVYVEHAYFTQLVTGAARAAHRRGYAIVLLPTLSRDDYWLDIPLDGIYIADPVADDPVVGNCVAAGIPVIANVPHAEGLLPWVGCDHDAAVRHALTHLYEAGARNIAVIAGESTALFHRTSVRACESWSAERDLPAWIVRTREPGNRDVLAAVEQVLCAPRPPDAILTLVEASTPLVVETIRRLGRSIPDDVLLVCTTEDPASARTDPAVSTLSFRPAQTAEAAIALLIDGRRGEPVTAELHIRASSTRPGPQR